MTNLVPAYLEMTAVIRRFPKTALKTPGIRGIRVLAEKSFRTLAISCSVRVMLTG
jgi:hypothetical protein